MKTFIISDPHFGHKNIITFKDYEGNIVRPFETIEEMDELIVTNWNVDCGKKDRVYVLGDVVMNRRCLPILERLNGRKCLIKGNHDIFKLKDYLPYFDDIRAYKIYPKLGVILSHIPVHPYQLQGRWKYNIHGHTHQNEVGDDRYINVCVEKTNYKLVNLQDIVDKYNLTPEQ